MERPAVGAFNNRSSSVDMRTSKVNVLVSTHAQYQGLFAGVLLPLLGLIFLKLYSPPPPQDCIIPLTNLGLDFCSLERKILK